MKTAHRKQAKVKRKWQAAIDKGRTPGYILNLISSKYTMSDQQKARVLSLKPTIKDPVVADMEAAETI